MIDGGPRRRRGFLPITVDLCIELFKILDNSLSSEVAWNIIGDDGEFL
jgi:hypothetical protein